MAKPARSTRSTSKKTPQATKKSAPGGIASKTKAIPRNRKAKPSTSDTDDPEEVQDKAESESDAYREDSGEDDVVSLHSDNLDEDEDEVPKPKKRKRAPTATSRPKSGAKRSSRTSPAKKKRKTAGEESDGPEEIELEDGQEIVGVVVQAPKSGRGGYLYHVHSCYLVRERVLNLCLVHTYKSHQARYPRIHSIFSQNSRSLSIMTANGKSFTFSAPISCFVLIYVLHPRPSGLSCMVRVTFGSVSVPYT